MVYERISSLIPKPFVSWTDRLLEYAGVHIEARRFVGFLFLFGLGLSIAIALNAYVVFEQPTEYAAAAFLVSFMVFAGGALFWLNSIAASKGKFVEKILPDALQLIASNIKAGLTTEKALFVSARPEFGPLSLELQETSKRILSGDRIEHALLVIPTKIKSKVLERTIWLITQGIKSGGQISQLLIKLSRDLREENALKSEVNANISMYVMLIFFSAAFGAPMLFGISSHIVGVLSGQEIEELTAGSRTGNIQMGGMGGGLVGGFISGNDKVKEVDENFVVLFCIVALTVTCIFAGLTLGTMSTGKAINGMKYTVVIALISFPLFFLVRAIMAEVMGSLGSFV